ncbi:MAG TPA: PilZ domain-containing protein [Armatimonadota bacterium]|nr:PilZ domain-containing protein [Armatimonadota bacterium]
MSLGSLALPLSPGARIEVELEQSTLVCRLQGLDGPLLRLTAPAGVSEHPAPNATATLVLFSRMGCMEAEGRVRHWVWNRPPVLVVEPVSDWRESCRRFGRRVARSLEAELRVGGTAYQAQTQDLSADGISLHVGGLARMDEGTVVFLRVRTAAGGWTEPLPVRVARVRRWLGLGESILELGAQLLQPTPAQARDWQRCLHAAEPDI